MRVNLMQLLWQAWDHFSVVSSFPPSSFLGIGMGGSKTGKTHCPFTYGRNHFVFGIDYLRSLVCPLRSPALVLSRLSC